MTHIVFLVWALLVSVVPSRGDCWVRGCVIYFLLLVAGNYVTNCLSTLFPMIGCVQGVPQLSTLFYIGSDLAGNSSMTMLVPGIRVALWLIVCFLFSKIILCKQIFFFQSCEYYLLVKSFASTCGGTGIYFPVVLMVVYYNT